jgi:hypothetical protein
MFEDWEYLEVNIEDVQNYMHDYEVEVESPDGYVKVLAYIEKGLKDVYKITCGELTFVGSSKHLVETSFGWKFLEDVVSGELVLTKEGFSPCYIEKLERQEEVVDISVDSDNHRYYTNGISSHNTNVGKSLIMTSVSSSLLYHNKNVLYISLEMSEEKISERIQANLFDINVNDLKLLDKKTFMKKHEALKQLTKSNLVIVQYGAKSVNANKVRSILKDLKMKKNFVPDVIFVDYLGLMTTNNKSKDSNSYTEMKTVSEELRAVFVEENIIGVSAIQTNRSGMNNVDLDMTNIADSIGTAATADLIVAVTQTDEMKEAGRYKFSIIKNRYGLNGQYTLVGVDYPKMRVYDIEDEDDSMPNTPKQGSTSITDDAVTLALSSFKGTTKKKQLDIIGME